MKSLIACLLILSPSLSYGAVDTQSVSVQAAIFDGIVEDDTVRIPNMLETVQPFDSELGELVSFTIEYSYRFDYVFTNSSDTHGGFGIFVGGDLLANSIDYGDLMGSSGVGVLANSTVPGDFGPVTYNQMFLASTADPALLAVFLGSEPVDLFWGSSSDLGGISGNNISSGTLSISEDSYITVSYDYMPVPEPSTSAVLAGVLGFGLASKRRRRRPQEA